MAGAGTPPYSRANYTSDPAKNYQWGTMEGGSTGGYFAIRLKSDVIYETEYNGARTQEKYCTKPGVFCGLILLTSTETGEPLAFLNDGHLQHMRVGADGGIGVKYMANPDAEVIGMLGSGGMARTHMQAFTRVRDMQMSAEAKYQEKIKGLETSLQDTQRKLNELQRNKEKGQRFVLSPEQQKELENFRKQEANVKVELKKLRRDLRQDIESMENRLKWLNIAGMPFLVTIGGIGLAVVKRKRTAAR